MTFYEEIGGAETLRHIVHRFYENVAGVPELRGLYPEADLGPAEERLFLFFCQYWGGPTTYSEQRGHPRLRMRHAVFAVTPHLAEVWLSCFKPGLDEALAAGTLTATQHEEFWHYATGAAEFLVNSAD